MKTNHNKIFLVGLPGCGKSTYGKQLAAEKGYEFTDLDTVIEEMEGRTIPEIFSADGEDRFRAIERQALEEVISRKGKMVIATGGGAPCFFDNMELMNKSGSTIYLNVPVEEIIKRLQSDTQNVRPLMGTNQPDEIHQRLTKLKAIREKFYKTAHNQLP